MVFRPHDREGKCYHSVEKIKYLLSTAHVYFYQRLVEKVNFYLSESKKQVMNIPSDCHSNWENFHRVQGRRKGSWNR